MIKIYQLIVIQDLVIEEKLINYKANIIPIKISSSIKISDPECYEEADFYTY